MVVPPDIRRRFSGTICFDFGVVPGGYAWLFPKKDHVSAGVLLRQGSARRLKPLLMDYLARNGLHRNASISSLKMHPIPCGPHRENRYAEARGLVVGDATGLVDPVTGEGLYYALKSARIAAAILKTPPPNHPGLPAERYSQLFKTTIEPEVLRADLLARILYRWPCISNQMLKLFGEKIGAKHIAVYRGAMDYRRLCRYVLSPKGLAYLLRPPWGTERHI